MLKIFVHHLKQLTFYIKIDMNLLLISLKMKNKLKKQLMIKSPEYFNNILMRD